MKTSKKTKSTKQPKRAPMTKPEKARKGRRRRGGSSHLTEKETGAIRAALKSGKTTAQVMERFRVSLSTVANHRRALRAK